MPYLFHFFVSFFTMNTASFGGKSFNFLQAAAISRTVSGEKSSIGLPVKKKHFYNYLYFYFQCEKGIAFDTFSCINA